MLKYPIILIIIFCSFNGNCQEELEPMAIKKLEQITNDNLKVNSTLFDTNDTETLVRIAKNTYYDYEIRTTALESLQHIVDEQARESIIDLKNNIDEEVFSIARTVQWRKEIDRVFFQVMKIYKLTLNNVSKFKDNNTLLMLKSEFNKNTWENRNLQNLPDEFIDDQFRLPVFKALAEIAIEKPDLFPYLETLQNNTNGWLSKNIKSLLFEYKEKRYIKYPDELPENGYLLYLDDDVNFSIFKMSIRIDSYYKSNKYLPENLSDLTIPNGGACAYIYGDKFSIKQDKFLIYKSISSIVDNVQYSTYILLSVGENAKIDIDISKLTVGMDNQKAHKVFKKDNDDIYVVATYINLLEQ